MKTQILAEVDSIRVSCDNIHDVDLYDFLTSMGIEIHANTEEYWAFLIIDDFEIFKQWSLGNFEFGPDTKKSFF